MIWLAFTYCIVDDWYDCEGCADETDDEFKGDRVKLIWIRDSHYSYVFTSVQYRHWKAVVSLPEFQ